MGHYWGVINYVSTTGANRELEIDGVPYYNEYYYYGEFDKTRSKGEITGNAYGNFISIVSDTKSENSEKKSIKSRFPKYEEKFLKDEVRSEISNFKPPENLSWFWLYTTLV